MTTPYPECTHAVLGAPLAAGIGRRSLVALAGLIGAVTLVWGLGGATTAAAAAADPFYAWATQGGGTGADYATGVSALPDGSSIITGQFIGTAATFGATTLTNAGSYDIFTAKVNADGTYAWATQGGGSGAGYPQGVSALPDGSSITTGSFQGTAVFGTTSFTSDAGSRDTFTAKVNADGTYAWATQGGGLGHDFAQGVSALPDGSSIITGNFDGTAIFGPTSFTSNAGSVDTFTAKVNADGTYAWAIKGGGTGGDYAYGVSALPDGSSIITGQFDGTAIFGATSLISAPGSEGIFTAKVNANGTYAWATRGGGSGSANARGVSALPDGSSIITGQFTGTATFGSWTLTSAPGSDTFTAKVNADGTYAWATQGGGTGIDYALGVSALPDGSSIITGSFDGTTATFGTTILTNAGSDADIFTARILADAPQAPTGASASAGISEATITWNAVAGGLVSSYTATAAPGGASCTAVAPATTCTITNLTAGTSYTVTVTATNPQGTSPPSQASNAVTPTDVALAPTGLALTPTAPVNTFTMKPPKIWPQKITTRLNLPGPGKVVQKATTPLPKPRQSAEMATTARTMTVCTARKTIAKAGAVTITCRLTAKARAARKTHSLRVRLVTTFTPTGGTAKSVNKTLVLKKTR